MNKVCDLSSISVLPSHRRVIQSLKIIKACDLSSISVLPLHLRLIQSLKISKACNLGSIPVLPSHLRRSNALTIGQQAPQRAACILSFLRTLLTKLGLVTNEQVQDVSARS